MTVNETSGITLSLNSVPTPCWLSTLSKPPNVPEPHFLSASLPVTQGRCREQSGWVMQVRLVLRAQVWGKAFVQDIVE